MKAKKNINALRYDISRNEFALTLKGWRLRNNLTQTEAGARLGGVSRFTIIRAETAKLLSWESIYKLFTRLCDELEKERRPQ